MPQKLKPEDLIAWQTEQGSLHGATEGACYREIPESLALERLIDAIKKENSVDDDMMDPVAIKICDGEYTTGAHIKTAVNQQLASLPWPLWRRLRWHPCWGESALETMKMLLTKSGAVAWAAMGGACRSPGSGG